MPHYRRNQSSIKVLDQAFDASTLNRQSQVSLVIPYAPIYPRKKRKNESEEEHLEYTKSLLQEQRNEFGIRELQAFLNAQFDENLTAKFNKYLYSKRLEASDSLKTYTVDLANSGFPGIRFIFIPMFRKSFQLKFWNGFNLKKATPKELSKEDKEVYDETLTVIGSAIYNATASDAYKEGNGRLVFPSEAYEGSSISFILDYIGKSYVLTKERKKFKVIRPANQLFVTRRSLDSMQEQQKSKKKKAKDPYQKEAYQRRQQSRSQISTYAAVSQNPYALKDVNILSISESIYGCPSMEEVKDVMDILSEGSYEQTFTIKEYEDSVAAVADKMNQLAWNTSVGFPRDATQRDTLLARAKQQVMDTADIAWHYPGDNVAKTPRYSAVNLAGATLYDGTFKNGEQEYSIVNPRFERKSLPFTKDNEGLANVNFLVVSDPIIVQGVEGKKYLRSTSGQVLSTQLVVVRFAGKSLWHLYVPIEDIQEVQPSILENNDMLQSLYTSVLGIDFVQALIKGSKTLPLYLSTADIESSSYPQIVTQSIRGRATRSDYPLNIFTMELVDNNDQLVGAEQYEGQSFGGSPIIVTSKVIELGEVYSTGMGEGSVYALGEPISPKLINMLGGVEVTDLSTELLALQTQYGLFPSKRGAPITLLYPTQINNTRNAIQLQTDKRALLTQTAISSSLIASNFNISVALDAMYPDAIDRRAYIGHERKLQEQNFRQYIRTFEPQIVNNRYFYVTWQQCKGTSNQLSSLLSFFEEMLDSGRQGYIVIDTLDAGMDRNYFLTQINEETNKWSKNLKALANAGFKVILTGCGNYSGQTGQKAETRKLIFMRGSKAGLLKTQEFGPPSYEVQKGIEKIQPRQDTVYKAGRVFSDINKVTATNKADRLEQTPIIGACVVIGTFNPVVLNIGTYYVDGQGKKVQLHPSSDELIQKRALPNTDDLGIVSWEDGSRLNYNIQKSLTVSGLREYAFDLIGDDETMKNLGFRSIPKFSEYEKKALTETEDKLSKRKLEETVRTGNLRNELVTRFTNSLKQMLNYTFSIQLQTDVPDDASLPTKFNDLRSYAGFESAFNWISGIDSTLDQVVTDLLDTQLSFKESQAYEDEIVDLITRAQKAALSNLNNVAQNTFSKDVSQKLIKEAWEQCKKKAKGSQKTLIERYFDYLAKIDLLEDRADYYIELFKRKRLDETQNNIVVVGSTRYSSSEEDKVIVKLEEMIKKKGFSPKSVNYFVYDENGVAAIVKQWADATGESVTVLPSYSEGKNWKQARVQFIKEYVRPSGIFVINEGDNKSLSAGDKYLAQAMSNEVSSGIVSIQSRKFQQPIAFEGKQYTAQLAYPTLKIYAITADLQGIKVGSMIGKSSGKYNNLLLSYPNIDDPYDAFWQEVCAACSIESESLSLSSIANKIPKKFKAPPRPARLAGISDAAAEKKFRQDWARNIGSNTPLGTTLLVSVNGDKAQKRVAADRLKSQFGSYFTRKGQGGRQRPITLMDEARKIAQKYRLTPVGAYRDRDEFFAWMVPVQVGTDTKFIRLDEYQKMKPKQLRKDNSFLAKVAGMMSLTQVDYNVFKPVVKIDLGEEVLYEKGGQLVVDNMINVMINAAEARREERAKREEAIRSGTIDEQQLEFAMEVAEYRLTDKINSFVNDSPDNIAKLLSGTLLPLILTDYRESTEGDISVFVPIFNTEYPNLKRIVTLNRISAASLLVQYMAYLSGLMGDFVTGKQNGVEYVNPARLDGKTRRRFDRIYRGQVSTAMYYQSSVLHSLLGYVNGDIKPQAMNFLHENQSHLLKSGIEKEAYKAYNENVKQIRERLLYIKMIESDLAGTKYKPNLYKDNLNKLLKVFSSPNTSNGQAYDAFVKYATPALKHITGATIDYYQKEYNRLLEQVGGNENDPRVQAMKQLMNMRSNRGLIKAPVELTYARTYDNLGRDDKVITKLKGQIEGYVKGIENPEQLRNALKNEITTLESRVREFLQTNTDVDVTRYIREKNPEKFQEIIMGDYENEALMGLVRGSRITVDDGSEQWVVFPYKMVDYAIQVLLRVLQEKDPTIILRSPKKISAGNVSSDDLQNLLGTVQLQKNPLYKYLSNL